MILRWLFSGLLVCLCANAAFSQVTVKVFNLASSHRELLDGTIDPDLCPDPPDDCHCKPSASHDTGHTGVFKEGSYVGKDINGNTVEFMNWRMVYPTGYSPTNPTKYPMIVMLHGAGEGGRKWNGQFDYQPNNVNYDNNGRNITHGGTNHRDAVVRNPNLSNSFPGIVIWPQVGYNGAWDAGWDNGNLSDNTRMAAYIIEFMISDRNVDPDRIVMHGLSNGAQGVWDLAAKRPDLFAAILPMSGVGTNLTEMVSRLVTTPIWIFQGQSDNNPNPSASLDWQEAFNDAGGNMIRTLYPAPTGHGTWNLAYAEANFFPYIKSKTKKDIYVFGGNPSVCPGGTLQLGFSANFLAYQWTRDGEDIPGATIRYYGAQVGGVYTVKYQRRNDESWAESNPLTVTATASSNFSPLLKNTGSTFIPVTTLLNGVPGNLPSVKNFVYLQAPTGYATYQWYKNGVAMSPPTTTTNERLVSQDAGVSGDQGTYTVKVVSGCVSDFSNPITLTWFSPQPTSPLPAKASTSGISSTSQNVTWPDYGSEVSYEVWRYRHANTYGEQNWTQITTLPANTLSFVDTGLRPGAFYKYVIRAILPNGSAICSPEGPDSWGIPLADNIPPTAPNTLSATNITNSGLTLSWLPSIDNDKVYKYEVYSGSALLQTITGNINDTPATATTINLTGLAPFTTYLLNVRGVDFTGNVSPFAEGISVTTGTANGVFYKYWTYVTTNMPGGTNAQLVEPRANNSWDFTQTPVKSGTISIFDLTQRTQNDRFVFSYDALIEILNAGTYTFYTTSAAGSRLYINGALVVNNDGNHGSQERNGTVTLGVGKHAIRVTYFDQTRTETLTVSYAGPSVAKVAIPAARLYLPTSNPGLNYYSLSTGDLADVNTWGVNPNGSGAHPPDFMSAASFYNIANRASATLSTVWSVSGSGSRVIVGTGSPITFDINAAFTGTMEAKEQATINVNTTTLPQFGVLATTSSVNFNTGSNTIIPNAVYGNVNLVSANQYTMPTSNTTILGDLAIANGVTTTGVATNTSRLIIGGNITFSNSSNPLPGTTANQYAIVFTGGVNHTVTFNTPVDPNFFSIQADVGDVVNFVNAGVHTYTVGSTLGGGISNNGAINLGSNNLVVSGRGTINANNETGILSINGGNLTLNSTAIQHSDLNFDATNNVVTNLSITLPSTYNANILSPATVNNLVSLNGGNLVTGDGNLLLTSSGSGTARIGPLGNGSRIKGNIIVQRYMEGEGTIFRYISMPVKGVKVADLQNYFPVTGNFTGASTGPGLNGNASLFDYQEPAGGYKQFPAVGGSNQDTLNYGRGYSAYIREASIATTIQVKGAPNQGTIPFTLTPGTTPSNGWNLVGNPYPAPIKWTGNSTGGWTMSGVNNTISIRENTSATTFQYRYWNGTAGDISNGVIAPGQAFWVQTTSASPTLTVGEIAKQTSDGEFLRDGGPENVVVVKMKNASLSDNAYIQFNRDATPAFEKALDATKLSNSFFNLSTLTSDGQSVAINMTTSGQCDQTVNFRITNAAVGSYQLVVTGVGSLVAGEQVIFTDAFTGTTLELDAEDYTHNFSITAAPASKADGRFKLKFIKPGVTYENTLASEAACNTSDPIIWIHDSQPGVDYKAFVNGTSVSGVAVGNGGDLALPVHHNLLPYGKTNLQLTAGFLGCQQFDMTNTVNVTRDTVDTPEIIMNQGVLSAGNLQGVEYQWFFEEEAIDDAITGEYTPVDSGAYKVQITKASCVLTSESFVKLPLHLNLALSSEDVCNTDAVVVVENTQPGVKYKAFLGSLGASTYVVGTGGPISLPLDASVITTGEKDIQVQAGFENDIPQFLASKITVQRNELATPQVIVDGTKLKVNVTGNEFKWYLDGQLITGATGNEIDFTTEGNYSVDVTSGVCSASSTTIPLSFTINTSLNATSQAQCESNPMVTIDDSQPGVTYAAYFNGILISDEVVGNGGNIALTINTSIGFGQKQLTIKAGYLNNEKHDLANPVTVSRQFLAAPTVSTLGQKLTVDVQDANYTWFMNGAEMTGEHASSIEPSESGMYYVVVSNGVCSKQSAPVEYSVTGLGDELSSTLTLSPNPARNRVVVVAPRVIDWSTVRLSTATGQGFSVPTSSLGDRSFEMDLSGLTAGFYLVQVNGQAIRLVKE